MYIIIIGKAVHEELHNAVEEREGLRQRLQEQIQAVITYEEAVASKVISSHTCCTIMSLVRNKRKETC